MIIRFMQEQSILETVLHQRKFVPRFSAENIGSLKLDRDGKNLNYLVYPKVSFCESKYIGIRNLAEWYGKYAVAFRKKWAIDKGLQPVNYMNGNSRLMNDTRRALHSLQQMKTWDQELQEQWQPIEKYMMEKLLLIKPCERDGVYLQEEQEWIYLPEKASAMSRLIYEKDDAGLAAYCLQMKLTSNKLEEHALDFEYEDIAAIYVPDQEAVEQILQELKKVYVPREAGDRLTEKIYKIR